MEVRTSVESPSQRNGGTKERQRRNGKWNQEVELNLDFSGKGIRLLFFFFSPNLNVNGSDAGAPLTVKLIAEVS